MQDFDKRFAQKRERFDRDFNQMKRGMAIMIVVNVVILVAVLGFVGWVIIQLMQYFGVI